MNNFREVVQELDRFESKIYFKKFNWHKNKRILMLRGITKFRKIILDFSIKPDFYFYILINSFEREIHDILPKPKRLLIDSYDRIFSISEDTLNEINSINKSYIESNSHFFNNDVIKQLIFEARTGLFQLKSEFEFFKFDYDKMNEGIPIEFHSNHSLIHFFIQFKLKFIKEHLNYWFDILAKSSSMRGMNEVQILNILGNKYKEGLKPNLIIQPFPYLLIGSNQVRVSKETSNKYILKILEIINEQLQFRDSKQIDIPNEFGDNRIMVGASPTVIREYFYKLTTKKGIKTGNPTISKSAIDFFLGANFKEFDYTPFNEKIYIETHPNNLRRFIYEFYKEFDSIKSKGNKEDYVYLLINNFSSFNKEDYQHIYKHMSDPRRNDYPF